MASPAASSKRYSCSMPAMSARVQEFYNHVHDKSTGRFSGRAASGREGFREGSHTGTKRSDTTVARRRPGTSPGPKKGGTATPENFPRGDGRKGPTHAIAEVTTVKSRADRARIAARKVAVAAERADGIRRTPAIKKKAREELIQGVNESRVRQGMEPLKGNVISPRVSHRSERMKNKVVTTVPQEIAKHRYPIVTRSTAKSGNGERPPFKSPYGYDAARAAYGPVTGAKLPLRNATTGRLNPGPVRAAFKQGTAEIIGRKTDSKRTTLKGGKVRTVKTYKGREVGHVSSKGGAAGKSSRQLARDWFNELRYYQD